MTSVHPGLVEAHVRVEAEPLPTNDLRTDAASCASVRPAVQRLPAHRFLGPPRVRSQTLLINQSSVKACRLSLLRRLFNGPRRKNLISFATGHYSPAISFSGTAASANAVGEILAPSATSLRPCT